MRLRGLKKSRYIYLALLLILSLPVAAGAMPWSWDMHNQKGHRAQKGVAPATPEGTITTEGRYFYAKDRSAAASIKNPVKPGPESIKRGKLKYGIYCSTCHGATGKGEGLVGQKYVPPTDLTGDYVQSKTNGDIFYTITNGGLAIMPSYADSMDPIDRWHIINYIKHALPKEGGSQ